MFDVIIIGAGPSGATASIYAKRGNLKTLMIHNRDSSLLKAEKIENYYGFEEGINPNNLYKKGIQQACNLGVQVVEEETLNIEQKESCTSDYTSEHNSEYNNKCNGDQGNYANYYYEVTTTKNKYLSKSIIIATGTKKKIINIKGIEKYEGKGISYCAICDGYFYKNKKVAILGSGNYAISEAKKLINIVEEITILTNGETNIDAKLNLKDNVNVSMNLNNKNVNINVNTKKIKEIIGNSRVEEIKFEDNTTLKIDGIFIAQGTATSIDFARKIGIITSKNQIIVNDKMETNIPGVFACGDCVGGLAQITKSVYEGTIAGLQAKKFVEKNK